VKYAAMVLLSGAALLSAEGTQACGDKLAALAGGVRYERLHRSEHPARLVFYAPTGSRLHDDDVRRRLATDLESVGHQVETVGDADALGVRLRSGDVDLVIADDGVLPPTAAGRAAVLRVGTGVRSSAAAETVCTTTLGRRGGRQLVRSVERVLEQRSRGAADACAVPAGVQGT
jgi:hypothetical protein